jgi:alkanesulfonate monooxygenase SsuD/methylene tetrahydromethanopterin reductase-like flavin-dependent oxidoreductase (luciferase family)
MLKLAAAEAGIAITNWLAPKDVPRVRDAVGPDCELVVRIFVCPTTDADTARFIGKRMVAAYLTVPVYAAFHQWLGRGDIIAPMLTAWNSRDRKGALEAIPDALVDELVIHGSAEECRERVAEYQAAGLDTPVIAIPPVPGLDLADTIRQLAPA